MNVSHLSEHENLSYERFLNVSLRLFTVFLFIGRAWQYIRWGSPWQQIIEPGTASILQSGIGMVFLLAAAFAAGLDKYLGKNMAIIGLFMGSLFMLVHSILSSMLQNWNFAQFIEHTLQWSIPLFLIGFLLKTSHAQKLLTGMRWAVALTFVGHGMFAAGLYLVPTHFLFMTQQILGLPAEGARSFLLFAGIMDFIVAIGLFVRGVDRYIVIYAIIWGTLTALARVIAYYDPSLPIESLDRWLYETIFRLGHGGIPLIIWMTIKKDFQPKFVNT